MRFSYRLIREKNGFLAECVEAEVAGEGATAKDAVESLRTSLEERMFRPDAIAPPATPTEGTIDLVLADGESRSERKEAGEQNTRDLDGPGDPPAVAAGRH